MTSEPADAAAVEAIRQRWCSVRRLSVALLLVWFGVTFGIAFFARELDVRLLGWPFSFWVAAQGAPLVYLVLVVCYARRTRRLDEIHGVAERD